MCAGHGSRLGHSGYRRGLPEVHFRSRGPGRQTANDNRRATQGPEAIVLSAIKLATMSKAALAGLALSLLPTS
ncbi:hypothetical protein CHKEEEPN_0170 [Methylorubrum podarium]|nr:hypothetical protein CHKEEEPN_0170 [Methylorubrum podarium]